MRKIKKSQAMRHRTEIMPPRSARRGWRLISRISALILSAAMIPSLHMLAQQPRLIEISALEDNKFKVKGQKGSTITVKPKEVIRFKIMSKWGDEKDPKWPGCPHSFSVKGYEDSGWNKCLKEGNNEFVLVAPGKAGEYKIECLAKCGKGHDDMVMKMIVAP